MTAHPIKRLNGLGINLESGLPLGLSFIAATKFLQRFREFQMRSD